MPSLSRSEKLFIDIYYNWGRKYSCQNRENYDQFPQSTHHKQLSSISKKINNHIASEKMNQ